jgi:hypothetical protein
MFAARRPSKLSLRTTTQATSSNQVQEVQDCILLYYSPTTIDLNIFQHDLKTRIYYLASPQFPPRAKTRASSPQVRSVRKPGRHKAVKFFSGTNVKRPERIPGLLCTVAADTMTRISNQPVACLYIHVLLISTCIQVFFRAPRPMEFEFSSALLMLPIPL